MFSLQQFFGRDPKFFDLFEACARESLSCANALKEVVAAPAQSANLHQVRQSRQKSKELAEQISELAVKTFITVIEREDIEALAGALYKIPKPMENFAERLSVTHNAIRSGQKYQQVNLICEAAQTVLAMIESLRTGINSEFASKLNTKLQALEAEADRLELELLFDLYNNVKDPIELIATKDLFDLLEKSIDRCRDAGNIVLHICHKNS